MELDISLGQSKGNISEGSPGCGAIGGQSSVLTAVEWGSERADDG